MKTLKPIYFILLLILSVFIESCDTKEAIDDVAIEEQISELDFNAESEFLNGKRFVITDTGERISEEKYILQLDESVYGSFTKKSKLVNSFCLHTFYFVFLFILKRTYD
ncbi:hypothetical protein [Aquimarina sp. AU474]|uniref:hypothetical protein n=1 Tax=Aquimarina sp. AU474 TaxID=2108529 RepID=UPI000D68576F|nr:hypothetical protein [Aquimarina sp. AU474]